MSTRRTARTVKILLPAFALAALGVVATHLPTAAPAGSSTTVVAGNTWSRTPVATTDRSSWSRSGLGGTATGSTSGNTWSDAGA